MLRRPLGFEITPGQRGDAPIARTLLEPLPPSRPCARDTAYHSDRLRLFLIERHTTPVIPNNPTLQAAQLDRAHVLRPQGLAPRLHTIRQARHQLRCRHNPRRDRHLVAMIESEPSAGNSWPGPATGSGRPSGTALPLAQ